MVGDYPRTTISTLPRCSVGNPNRYWRANESGEYIQDKFQIRSNLSITAGLRWDWDGGLTEKYGNLLNFDPSRYNYNPLTDTIVSNGLIVAGNNPKAATPGVSNTTLTGRQWGFAPRIGVAWSPKMFNNKFVVRAGWGMYYDRGELFSYLSPGTTQNITTGGPFGINESQPFVNTLSVANPTSKTRGVPLPTSRQRSHPGIPRTSFCQMLARWPLAPGIRLPMPDASPTRIIPRPSIWPTTRGTTSFPTR